MWWTTVLWRVVVEVSVEEAQHFLFLPVHSIRRTSAHRKRTCAGLRASWWATAPSSSHSSTSAQLPSAPSHCDVLFSFPTGASFHPSHKCYSKMPYLHCCTHHCRTCSCFSEQEWQSQVQFVTSAKKEQDNRKQVLAQGKQKITFTW